MFMENDRHVLVNGEYFIFPFRGINSESITFSQVMIMG